MDQGSDDVGAETVAVQPARCSALMDRPGYGRGLGPASEGPHSRTGWMGGNHLLSIDPVLGCRHHGHLGSLQASPIWKTLQFILPLWPLLETSKSVCQLLDNGNVTFFGVAAD